MPASIKDIAKRLNISVSTVSYALNGGPRPVKPEVREKVLAVARDLNYRPNRVARSMITGRSHTIGIVPPEVGYDVFMSPYLQLALNGIANAAGALHQDMLLFTRYDDSHKEALLDTILDGRADGVIFLAPMTHHRTVEVATGLRLPCVIMSGAPVEGLVSFSVNNELGVYQAMEHLFGLGHRRIGHIAGRLDMQDAMVRLEAYQKFLYDKRIPYNDEWVANGGFVYERGKDAMVRLMSLGSRPTAVFCANDEMALGALDGAYEVGLKIPGDVSIVGFDLARANNRPFIPDITTIRQPVQELGAAAVRTLVELIEGRPVEDSTIFGTELVIRASTTHPKEDLN